MLTIASGPSGACRSSPLIESLRFTLLHATQPDSPPPLNDASCPRMNYEYKISFLVLLAGCLQVET